MLQNAGSTHLAPSDRGLEQKQSSSCYLPYLETLGSGLLRAGEFGTTYTTQDDIAWIHDFTEYINNIGAADDGLHNNIASWFYW